MTTPTTTDVLNRQNEAVDALETAVRTVTDGAAQLGNALHKTGAETVAGVKTFADSPVVPTPTAGDNSTKAASTAFVQNAVAGKLDKTGGKITENLEVGGNVVIEGGIHLPDVQDIGPGSARGLVMSHNDDWTHKLGMTFLREANGTRHLYYTMSSADDGKQVFIDLIHRYDGARYLTCSDAPDNAVGAEVVNSRFAYSKFWQKPNLQRIKNLTPAAPTLPDGGTWLCIFFKGGANSIVGGTEFHAGGSDVFRDNEYAWNYALGLRID